MTPCDWISLLQLIVLLAIVREIRNGRHRL